MTPRFPFIDMVVFGLTFTGLVLFLLIFTSCAAPRPCVSVDDFNTFRFDVYRALDSIRHGEYDDAWRMK